MPWKWKLHFGLRRRSSRARAPRWRTIWEAGERVMGFVLVSASRPWHIACQRPFNSIYRSTPSPPEQPQRGHFAVAPFHTPSAGARLRRNGRGGAASHRLDGLRMEAPLVTRTVASFSRSCSLVSPGGFRQRSRVNGSRRGSHFELGADSVNDGWPVAWGRLAE
jgi:hypothetical protein